MLAKLRIDTIISEWVPPFRKEKVSDEITINNNKAFHKDNEGVLVFKIESFGKDYIILSHDRKYNLKIDNKDLEQKLINGKKCLKLKVNDSASFSYMWSNKGITKKITLLAISE